MPRPSASSTAAQVCIIYAGVHGYLDRISVGNVTRYEDGLISELEARGRGILEAVRKEGALSEAIEGQLKELLDRYTQAFAA
jgi:F-type H+-transporting ATPase subunit alpha